MADVTVKQLAQVVGIPVERLLNQLQEAGLSFTDDHQTVNEDQKRILLNYLKGSSTRDLSVAPERITLRKKSMSQVTLGHDSHSGKTVNIEVRKKKTFVKRSSIPEQTEIEEQSATDVPADIENQDAVLLNEEIEITLSDDAANSGEIENLTAQSKDASQIESINGIEPVTTESTGLKTPAAQDGAIPKVQKDKSQ